MIKNKKALDNQEHYVNPTNSSLSQWNRLCKQAFDKITDACENGSLKDLIYLRTEIVSEKTNNERDLIRIDKAIKERFA